MTRFKLASLVLFVSLSLVAPVARAQSAADKAAAEALFDEGKRLLAAKRYAEACPKFADSQRLDPAVGTLLNLALCYKEAGLTASAWSTYREAAAQAATAQQTDREELARSEAAALEPKLTKLVIEVSPEVAKVPGVEIKRDGAPVPQGLWGIAAPVDPGVRTIDVTAPGKKPLRMEARAEGAGATAKVVISALEDASSSAAPVPVAAAAEGTPPPADQPQETPADTGSKPGQTQRILGYVAGGLGVVGIAVGIGFFLESKSENDKALALCEDEDDECTESNIDDHEDHVNAATAAQLNSFVAYGLGAAGIITGAILVLTAPSGEKQPAARVRVTPDVAANRFGLNVSGAW